MLKLGAASATFSTSAFPAGSSNFFWPQCKSHKHPGYFLKNGKKKTSLGETLNSPSPAIPEIWETQTNLWQQFGENKSHHVTPHHIISHLKKTKHHHSEHLFLAGVDVKAGVVWKGGRGDDSF